MLTTLAQAQEPIKIGPSNQDPTAASPTSQRPPRPKNEKTEPLLFTFSLSPETSEPDADTLPDARARQYDPARKQAVDYGNLGNLGSSARPLFYEARPRRGFFTGIQPFELYQIRPENLKFYRNARAFSEVAYSRGKTQDDGEITAKLARTFDGGFSVALDYRNINHLGQYRYQRTKHNSIAIGGWLPAGKRYDGFLVFSQNTSKQQENGGIADPAAFAGETLSGPIDLAIRLPDQTALTRIGKRDFQLTQHLKIAGAEKTDSLGNAVSKNRRALRLTHQLTFGRETFKFADANPRNDTFFFQNFITDERGLRHYGELKTIENAVSLTTFKPKKSGSGSSDFLSAGIAHKFFNLNQEPENRKFSNLFLTGAAAFTPNERFKFSARGDLGLLENIGEYQIFGELKLGLGPAGELRGGLLAQRYPASMIARKLFVSHRLFWENDFLKPIENSLSATYALPSLGFEATAKTHLLNNFIYFDQKGLAAQTTAALSVNQLLLRENFRLGVFRFDNTVAFQKANRSDVLRLPEWFSKNSVYFSGRVFKKNMLLETGVDFRTSGAFQADAYQPLHWQFHLSDSVSNPKPYLLLDFFAAFKVSNFRVFVRYENLSMLWDGANAFYQTFRYPQPPPTFPAPLRIGIRWRFSDSNLPENEGENTGPNSGGPPSGFGGGGIPRF